MPDKPLTEQQLLAENEGLRVRLAQAEGILLEMRSGEVDALVIPDVGGAQLFLLKDVDQSFRILVEKMSEGALTMTAEGLILYANQRMAGMLKTPLEKVMGSTLRTWIAPGSQPILQSLLEKDAGEERRAELVLAASDGTEVPVHLSVNNLPTAGRPDAYCLVAIDLTEHNRIEVIAASERVTRELLAAANQSRGELMRVIEDKSQAEVALRASQQLLKQTYDALDQAIFVVNPANRTIVTCNAATTEVFGYQRDELIGRTTEFLHVDQAAFEEFGQRLFPALDATGAFHTEFQMRRKNGEIFFTENTVTQIHDDAGRRTGVVSVVRDITERKRAVEALQTAEQQQRQLAENLEVERSRLVAAQRIAKIGSWETLLATMSVHWSDETHRIYETDSATFHPTHESFLHHVHPEDRARVDEAFARSLAGGAASAIEHRLLMPDKRIKYVEEHWQVFSDTQGVPIRAVGTCQDISERKRMETALQESEAEFRLLAEAMPQIVWVARVDGWNTYISQQWTDYTGLTLEESLGHGWSKPFHPDDRQRAWYAWQQARETINIYSIECRLRRADGVYRWWLVRAVPLKGANGEILKWFGTCTDIHDLKMAQLDIMRHVEKLQIAVMSTVQVATTLSEMRDPYTAGHERRVAEIAVAIGAELGLDERRQEGLRVAGHLHDVGKITIPSEILSKPGKLSKIEYQLIQGHAQAGYDVLKAVEFPWPVAQVALQHHERMDGSGYPQGLKGEAILFEARIMAVADVVESMSSHRPYRPALGIEAALAEIEHGRGTAYDPVVADACMKLFREKAYAIPA